ncbi:MAG: hypothetical protein ACOCT9_02800 [archaeon]
MKSEVYIYTFTPDSFQNFFEIPKSAHTRKKVEKIGIVLKKVLKSKEYCLYHCPGFNSRIYYQNNNETKDKIQRILNMYNLN